MTPDDVPFSPLPSPLTPRLLAVREQTLTDMAAADAADAKAAWRAFCERHGMDTANVPERYVQVWTWAWGLYQTKGANE